jgi:hypothetical protein
VVNTTSCLCLTGYDLSTLAAFGFLFALVFVIWLLGEVRDERSPTRRLWDEGGPAFVLGYWLAWLLSRPVVWAWRTLLILLGILVAWPILAVLDTYHLIKRWLEQSVDWWLLKHQLRARSSWWLWRKWTMDLPVCAWCKRRAGDMHSCVNDPIRIGRAGAPPAGHPYAWFCGHCATRVQAVDPAWEDEEDRLCPVCAGTREPATAPRWVRGRDVGAALTPVTWC